MQYQRFDPTGCDFPPPNVPVLLTLGAQSQGNTKVESFKPLGSDGDSSFFIRGRYALTEAYRLAGLAPHSTLLAPAYHCRTMQDPAIRLGAPISLYTLNADLSPDLAALAACLATCHKPVKAMLLTHYFGFAQALKPIADFCAQHGITLIEDCSHALCVSTHSATNISPSNLTMDKTGRYCVASPYKFLASEDGVLSWTNAHDAPPLAAQKPQSFKKEHVQSLACSRCLMRHSNQQHLKPQRRQHYQKLASTAEGLPTHRALFHHLRADCLLYIFRWLTNHPDTNFFALRMSGISIWRRDDMAMSACQTATNYRLKLFHQPCHQELTPVQMTWMTSTQQNVIRRPPAGHPR